jgi:hypothetical protein
LKTVPARQGALWMRDGFRLFSQHPLAFSLMFVVFMSGAVVGSAVPLLGGIFVLGAVPLLGLGFMVAAESALNGGTIHPGHFIAPLRGESRRRRSQIVLCAAFGVATLGVMLLAHWVDDGAFGELQQMMANQAPQAEIDNLLAEPRFAGGLLVRFGLAALVSIPFWHAPALVHWGGQGAAQALFSSTLAVWRNRGAFVVYLLSWLGIVMLFGLFAALAFGLLGMRQMFGLVALPAGLIFSTVFYVSLLFTFTDSFGGTGVRPPPP